VIEQVRNSLAAHLDANVVNELLEAYQEAKRNFYQGGQRLSAVEGGRFCEAAFRLLEQATTGAFTPLGRQLNAERVTTALSNLPNGSHPDSIRLHIPRALRVVYDIRNNRDTAHLGDGIDPNVQDATLVAGTLDWVLAEFLRLFHNVAPDEAQTIVEALVTRRAPVIEDFDGFLKVLNPDLSAGEHVLVLLYQRGKAGASYDELYEWARPAMRANLRRTISRLVEGLNYAHGKDDHFTITRRGMVCVEEHQLLVPA
jgi:hypothetical protein